MPKGAAHARPVCGAAVSSALAEPKLRKALSTAHHGPVSQTGRIVMHGSGGELAANDDVKKAWLGV